MKIWPFDDLSIPMDGQHVDRRSLAGACRTLAAIREAVDDELEIAVEGHSCWSVPAAIQIANAVEEFRPLWLEDFLQARNPSAWRRLREETGSPICGSERLFTRWEVEPFLREGAVDVVSQDVAWTGGIAETRTVAAIAELHELPVTLHCCHGPVATAASVHVAASVPNIHFAEAVRGFVREIHPEIVEAPVAHRDGRYLLPTDPGLGVQLRDTFVASAQIQRSHGEVSAIGWTAGDPWSNDTGNRI